MSWRASFGILLGRQSRTSSASGLACSHFLEDFIDPIQLLDAHSLDGEPPAHRGIAAPILAALTGSLQHTPRQ
jgi:hypothetical protein